MAKIINVLGMVLKQKQDDGRVASFTFAVRNDYPRVTVYLDENKRGFEHMIISGMTFPGILTLLSIIEGEIKDGEKKRFNALNIEFVNDVKTDKKIISGGFVIYRNEDGEKVLEVHGQEHKYAKFILTIDSDWFQLPGMTKRDISDVFVRSYVGTMKELFSSFLAKKTVEEHTKNIEDRTAK